MPSPGTGGDITSLIITIVLIVLILGYVVFRQLQQRTLTVDRLWVMPILILALVVLALTQTFQRGATVSPLEVGVAAAGFLVGGAYGFFRGSLLHIQVNRPAGTITVKGTPVGVIVFVAVLAIRLVAEYAIERTSHGNLEIIQVLTAAFLGLFAGTIIFRRAYLYWRFARGA